MPPYLAAHLPPEVRRSAWPVRPRTPFMGQSENINGEFAGRLNGQRGHGGIVKLAISIARKELIAVDQTGKCHRLASQGMDHMAVVHDVAAPAVTVSPTALKGHEVRRPKVEVEPVVMQPDTQAMTDQAGWQGVKDPPEDEAARRRHGDMGFFAVCGAAGRQRLTHSALGIDTLAVMGIAPTAELTKEPAIGGKIDEVGRAAQQKSIHDSPFHVPIRTLSRTVLMRDPAVVGSQPLCRHRLGHDLCVKDPSQRIGPSPISRRLRERRQLRGLLLPVARGRVESGFGCRDGHRTGRSA